MWQLQYERLAARRRRWIVTQRRRSRTRSRIYRRSASAFGRPIAQHQVIAHKLADAATELSAARALLYSTAWAVMQGDYPVAEISMCKKYCAQVQNRLVDACLQVYGGRRLPRGDRFRRAFRATRACNASAAAPTRS